MKFSLYLFLVLLSGCNTHAYNRVVYVDAPPEVVWSRIEAESKAQGRVVQRSEGAIVDVGAFPARLSPEDVSWEPFGHRLAVIDERRLRIWEPHDPTLSAKSARTSDLLSSVVWGPEPDQVWTLSRHGELIRWSIGREALSRLENIRIAELSERIISARILAQSLDKTHIAVSLDGVLRVLRLPDAEAVFEAEGALSEPSCVSFGEEVFYAPLESGGWAGWDLTSGARWVEVTDAGSTPCVLYASSQKQVLGTGDDTHALRVWTALGEVLPAEVPRAGDSTLRLEAVSELHVLLRGEEGLQLLNRASGEMKPLTAFRFDARPRFHTSGALLLEGAEGRSVKAIDVESGEPLWKLGGLSRKAGVVSVEVAAEDEGTRVELGSAYPEGLDAVLEGEEGESWRGSGLLDGDLVLHGHSHAGFFTSSSADVSGGLALDLVGRAGARFVLDPGDALANTTVRHALNLWGGVGAEYHASLKESPEHTFFMRFELGLEYEWVRLNKQGGELLPEDERVIVSFGPSLLTGSALGVDVGLEVMLDPWVGLYARVGYLFEEEAVIGTFGISGGWKGTSQALLYTGGAALAGLIFYGILYAIATHEPDDEDW